MINHIILIKMVVRELTGKKSVISFIGFPQEV